MASDDAWGRAFTAAFSTSGAPVEQRVYAAVIGAAHPTQLDTYSCLTWSELQRCSDWLAPACRDGVLVDLGCGHAGPGTWVAARAGARLVGLDVTTAPFAAARSRAADAGVPAELRLGSWTATGLDDESVDAVLSIDALQFEDDVDAALTEVLRVLRPGGRLAVTTVERVEDLDRAVAHPPGTGDRARTAGLVVEACWTPTDWPATARRIGRAMLEAAAEVAAETGGDVDEVRAALERVTTHPQQERRVVLLAGRPA